MLGGEKGRSMGASAPSKRLSSIPYLWPLVIVIVLLLLLTFSWSSVDTPTTLSKANSPIDAIVFICMGKWTQTAILEHGINSLRSRGGWAGAVYVLTDRDDGWPVLRDVYNVNVVTVPPADSKLAIHSYKCKMFDYVAADVKRVLYMDADIIVSTNMKRFLSHLDLHLVEDSNANMGLFQDAGGHFWGGCQDCDYWHGGVMFATRGQSEPCLGKWCDEIFSGKYTADQAALDYISTHVDECSGMFAMDGRYLMFMKDYTSVFFNSAKTFSHVTAAGRMEEQSWFYRWIVRVKLGIRMENA